MNRIGDTALLRICTCPVGVMAEAGSPAMTTRARRLFTLETWTREEALRLAETLHRRINRGDLARATAKFLGKTESRLRRGCQMSQEEAREVGAVIADAAVSRAMARLARRLAAVARLDARLAAEIEASASSGGQRLWKAAAAEPELRRLLGFRDPEFHAQCLSGGSEPDFWSGKRGRRRAAYLKDILRRATVRTVPRDWHTRVGLAEIGGGHAPRLAGQHAEVARANLHGAHRDASMDWSEDDLEVPLTLAPLSWSDRARVGFVVTDWDNHRVVREVNLNRSDFFAAIHDVMAGRAISYRQIRDALSGRIGDDEGELLPGFLRYLIDLGVIQARPTLRDAQTGWQDVVALSGPAGLKGDKKNARFTDVYVRMSGGVQRMAVDAVEAAVPLIGRLASVLERAHWHGPYADAEPALAPPARVVDLARARLMAEAGERPGAPAAPAPRLADWPLPPGTGTAYDRLHAHIAARFGGDAPIVIDGELLDRIGAPAARPLWPCDAMVRLAAPGSDYVAVFDECLAAGSMDSRFFDAMRGLGFDTGSQNRYRAFLDALETDWGLRFVELLFPPLARGAANAVIRPDYVRRWTGDPATGSYFPTAKPARDFVPLDRVWLHQTRLGARLSVEGEPVIAMYHATRLPIAPWNVLTDILLNAAPFPMRWSPRKMKRLLDAFPRALHAPRVEIAGGIVVSCAQWRLPAEAFPGNASPQANLAMLAHLRKAMGMPRLVFLSPGPGRRPEAADLDDPAALRQIEAMRATASDLILIAMTPDPESMLLRKGHRQFASCAQLRLPSGRSPETLAAEIGPHIRDLCVDLRGAEVA